MAHTNLNGISLESSLSLQCPLVRLHGGPLCFTTVPTTPCRLSLTHCTNPSFRSALLHFCSGLVSTALKKLKPFAREPAVPASSSTVVRPTSPLIFGRETGLQIQVQTCISSAPRSPRGSPLPSALLTEFTNAHDALYAFPAGLSSLS